MSITKDSVDHSRNNPNVPEDDYKQAGSRERKFENGFIQKSPLIAADSDEVIMGRDNHVLSISMEKL